MNACLGVQPRRHFFQGKDASQEQWDLRHTKKRRAEGRRDHISPSSLSSQTSRAHKSFFHTPILTALPITPLLLLFLLSLQITSSLSLSLSSSSSSSSLFHFSVGFRGIFLVSAPGKTKRAKSDDDSATQFHPRGGIDPIPLSSSSSATVSSRSQSVVGD